MIQEMLSYRQLPELPLTREETLDILQKWEYGYTPEAPKEVRVTRAKDDERCFAGKATRSSLIVSFDAPKGECSFPLTLIAPAKGGKHPAFVYINFRPEVPDQYLPAEEIIDNGYLLATFCYTNVTSDKDACDGIAALYDADPETGWGKIGMWAFAASRVMDYLQTRDDVDRQRVAVSGHSRLGKTALWCGAQDERFSLAISNDSGCGGAAIHRMKTGEHIEFMSRVIAYWFCGNFKKFPNREAELPYDQHFLLSLLAPRHLYVNSAEEDDWADPTSEFLACVAASPAWGEGNGVKYFADELPSLNVPLHMGDIGYHSRTGSHYHSRTDWLYQMAYRAQHGI